MQLKRGQTQVLTAVLLGGILIAGVAGAYVWGLPLLQKNQDINSAKNSLSSMKELTSAISTVAQQGGSRSVTMPLGDGSLRISPENDTVTFQARTRGAYVATESWVPLNENDMQGIAEGGAGSGHGIRGDDKPGVLIGRAVLGDDAFVTTYRIAFRPMEDPTSGQTHSIDLVQDGRMDATNGKHTVVITQGEEVTESGAGIDGGTLQRQQVLIRIS